MAGEKEGENVNARGDPTVVCILRVTSVHHFVELTHRGEVFLSQRKILHQSYAPDVEKYSHEKLKRKSSNRQNVNSMLASYQ